MSGPNVLQRVGSVRRAAGAVVAFLRSAPPLALIKPLVLALFVVDLVFVRAPWTMWVEFLLAGAVILLGREVLERASQAVSRRRLDGHVALAAAACGAFGYSFLTTLLGTAGRLGEAFAIDVVGDRVVPGLYFTTSATLVLAGLLAQRLLERCESSLTERLAGIASGADASPRSGPPAPAPFGDPDSHAAPDRWSRWWRIVTGLVASVAVVLAIVVAVRDGGILDDALVGLSIGLLVAAAPYGVPAFLAVFRKVGAVRVAVRGGRFRDPAFLDRLARTNMLVFRHATSLTTGCPQVTDVLPTQPGVSADEMLYLASALIYRTDHPARDAILLRSSEICRTLPHIKEYRFIAGRGIRAMYQGEEIILGNLRYLSDRDIDFSDVRERLDALASEGKTVLLLTKGETVSGIIAVADDVRNEARDAIEVLRRLRIRTLLISGDHSATVEVLRREVGLDDARGELTREELLRVIDELRDEGKRVSMVASDDFDVPTLTRLEIGIVFARDASETPRSDEVRLRGDDLREVPALLRIARQTRAALRRSSITLALCQTALLALLLAPFAAPDLGGVLLTGAHRAHWAAGLGFLAAILPAVLARLALWRVPRWPSPPGPGSER